MRLATVFQLTLLAICAGAVLGIAAWLGDRAEFGSPVWYAGGLANLPALWLATSFGVGAIAKRPLPAAVLAALALTIAVIAYYGAIRLSGDRDGIPLRSVAIAWIAVSLAAGPIFGIAGAMWRTGPRLSKPVAVGLLAGSFAPLGLDVIWRAVRYGASIDLNAPDEIIRIGLLGAAIVLPIMLLGRGAARVQAAAVTLAASAVYIVAVEVIATVLPSRLGIYSL